MRWNRDIFSGKSIYNTILVDKNIGLVNTE